MKYAVWKYKDAHWIIYLKRDGLSRKFQNYFYLYTKFEVYDCDGTCVTYYYGVQSLQHIPHLMFHFVMEKNL